MPQSLEDTCVVTKIRVKNDVKIPFADWQAKFNVAIAAFPGFLSLEILSPTSNKEPWVIVQRFENGRDLSTWLDSAQRNKVIQDLKPLLTNDPDALRDAEPGAFNQTGIVTEVFVTKVSPGKEKEYRDWSAKIHQVEANFPGFKGVYVQSSNQPNGQNWITMLQFDTQENLDRWLTSAERQQVLLESKSLISSLESQRVISPYAGWFASIAKKGVVPAVWKQTMIVLLVLFPIVMLEIRFLNPLLKGLNISLATFIGNAISVSLVSWPMVPIAIYYLSWWLTPPKKDRIIDLKGAFVVLGLYLLEIILLWRLI